jgi:hypothetical protein
MKYRTTHSTDRFGDTLWAVEKYDPETKEYGIVKIFTNRNAAEDEKQSLETYEKIL